MTKNKVRNFGAFLGSPQILDVKIDVFSNGNSSFISDEISYDKKGQYLGICYQCVELVRRFIYLKYNVNLAIAYQDGDAKDWYDNHSKMNLSIQMLKNAGIGDIITFTGGNWGHVGIISNLDVENIYVTSQNFMNDERDIDFKISRATLASKEYIIDGDSNKFQFQSLLRFKG